MFGLGNVFEMEILKSEQLSMQHLAFAWECPDREIARFQIMISDVSSKRQQTGKGNCSVI